MNVLVCGGREYKDLDFLARYLGYIHSEVHISKIINGNARGADTLSTIWAENNKILMSRYPAEWKKYGRSAGHRRNKQMLDEEDIDLVVAFPGGKGTRDMIHKAMVRKIPVILAGERFSKKILTESSGEV